MEMFSENRRAKFDYEILDTLEAGIVLHGFEVKSVRLGRMNLAGAHVLVRGNELWLLNADIPPYQPNNTPNEYDSTHTRRLLAKKDEIKALIGKQKSAGLTLVPLKVYNKAGLIKVLVGLAKPKKKGDKREAIRKREAKREIARTLKR